jgi:predicted metal-dependent hydrolase
VTFPKGESYFVDSVRRFRDSAPPKLAAEIQAFIKQEVMHTREHVAFNRHVADQGYDSTLLDRDVEKALGLTKDRPPIAALAATTALEHFTAMLAHELVANPRHLAGADEQARALWLWHAAEEIEHKGVAYDTWLHATRDWTRVKRWWVKSVVMLVTTWHFFGGRARGMLELLRQDGLTGPKIWGRLAWYAFGNPGMARKVARVWIAYFLPGFHPWNHDDRALIRLAESDYEAAVLPRHKAA